MVTVFREDALLPVLVGDLDAPAQVELLAPIPVGDGPTHLDLRPVPPSSLLPAPLAETEAEPLVEVLTTGFFDDTVTRTVVASDGSAASQETIAMPEQCARPVSALWLPDGGFAVRRGSPLR